MRTCVIRTIRVLCEASSWTEGCSGCNGFGSRDGLGCHECGYHDRRRDQPGNVEGSATSSVDGDVLAETLEAHNLIGGCYDW